MRYISSSELLTASGFSPPPVFIFHREEPEYKLSNLKAVNQIKNLKMKKNYLHLSSYTLFFLLAVFLFGCTVKKQMQTTTTTKVVKEISSVPETTGNAESLTKETNESGSAFYPRVSPDGKYLLYTAIEKGVPITNKVENESSKTNALGDFLNHLKTGNTTKPTTATNTVKVYQINSRVGKIMKKEIGSPIKNPIQNDGAEATWSLDGNSIIFSYRKPSLPVLVRTNYNGVGLDYISQNAKGSDDSQPNITLDGNTVIFTTIIDGNRMICSMDTKGGKFTVLTAGEHVNINPKEGSKIIYNLKVGDRTQLFTMDMKTGQKSQLTSGDYDSRDGAFSPDGNWIAFASNQENPKSTNYHIYIMRIDGTDMKQLTQGNTDEGDVCWSPNFWVFFYSNADNGYNIWKIKPRM